MLTFLWKDCRRCTDVLVVASFSKSRISGLDANGTPDSFEASG